MHSPEWRDHHEATHNPQKVKETASDVSASCQHGIRLLHISMGCLIALTVSPIGPASEAP
jgi:hypothetical protein